MSPLNAAICTTISYTLWVECCGKNVITANICKQWTKVITIIVSSNEQFCWIYLNYLTLRSKVKVPRMSLQYVTHHLMVMHPLNKYHWLISNEKNVMARTRKYYLKKQLYDLEVKGQGPTKVITVCDTPPYGHAPTYQISLTYLERQKCYGLDKKILFKKTLFDLEFKGQGPMKVITLCDTPPYGHAPTYQI